MTKKGKLIVIEGADGAGTSTQVAVLAQILRELGHAVHATREPSDGPIGAMIRQILFKRIVSRIDGRPKPPCMQTIALLFAADRTDHCENEIIPAIKRGEIVLTDRYYHSSYAYQGATSLACTGTTWPWFGEINAEALCPDLTIILDIDIEAAAARREGRGGDEELFEVDEIQQRVCNYYRKMPNSPHLEGETIVIVDGAARVDVVTSSCLEIIQKHLSDNP